jgi:hypothetical protein
MPDKLFKAGTELLDLAVFRWDQFCEWSGLGCWVCSKLFLEFTMPIIYRQPRFPHGGEDFFAVYVEIAL